jgi:uncharacterized damage-inducible protein DinB
MRKSLVFTGIYIFFLFITTHAQFADTVKAQLIRDWQRARAYTSEYLDAMPISKYNFRPNDSVRSFAQQMLHLAHDIIIMVSYGTGKERIWQGQNIESRTTAEFADSVRYFVNSGYDYAISAIKNMDASNLAEKYKHPRRNLEETRLAWLLKAFEHQTHHRGQTTIYIRLVGIKPPNERLF